jgi:hypothetical protein
MTENKITITKEGSVTPGVSPESAQSTRQHICRNCVWWIGGPDHHLAYCHKQATNTPAKRKACERWQRG